MEGCRFYFGAAVGDMLNLMIMPGKMIKAIHKEIHPRRSPGKAVHPPDIWWIYGTINNAARKYQGVGFGDGTWGCCGLECAGLLAHRTAQNCLIRQRFRKFRDPVLLCSTGSPPSGLPQVVIHWFATRALQMPFTACGIPQSRLPPVTINHFDMHRSLHQVSRYCLSFLSQITPSLWLYHPTIPNVIIWLAPTMCFFWHWMYRWVDFVW